MSTGIGAGGDTLSGIDNVIGSNFDDTITGNDNANIFESGEGDDVLEGRAGGDTLDGGAGTDTARYTSYKVTTPADDETGVTIARGAGDAASVAGIGGDAAGDGFDTIINSAGVDKLIFRSSSDNVYNTDKDSDSFSFDFTIGGSDSKNLIITATPTGSAGGNVVTILGYIDLASANIPTLHVRLANGNVDGTDDIAITVVLPDAGSEGFPFRATSGADTVENTFQDAESGTKDWVTYADSTSEGVTVDLADSTKNVGAYAAGDVLISIEEFEGSNSGDDILRGDDEANIIYGNNGSDILEGRGGADKLYGFRDVGTGSGSDTASYEDSAKKVYVDLTATDGEQRATFDNAELAEGGANANGDAAGDTLIGIENLRGSRHDDVLIGDGEVNVLEGGAGADRLSGGAGNDTYLFNRGDGSATLQDTITDNGANIVRFIDGATAYAGVALASASTADNTLLFSKSGSDENDLAITATDGGGSIETSVLIDDYFLTTTAFTIYYTDVSNNDVLVTAGAGGLGLT